jgi:hypothetical protein
MAIGMSLRLTNFRLWPFSALRSSVFRIDRMAAVGERGHTGEH